MLTIPDDITDRDLDRLLEAERTPWIVRQSMSRTTKLAAARALTLATNRALDDALDAAKREGKLLFSEAATYAVYHTTKHWRGAHEDSIPDGVLAAELEAEHVPAFVLAVMTRDEKVAAVYFSAKAHLVHQLTLADLASAEAAMIRLRKDDSDSLARALVDGDVPF